eukprot:COSAG06_NODE_42263_length_383_cov_0.936620_1_plen_32_part_10
MLQEISYYDPMLLFSVTEDPVYISETTVQQWY